MTASSSATAAVLTARVSSPAHGIRAYPFHKRPPCCRYGQSRLYKTRKRNGEMGKIESGNKADSVRPAMLDLQ
ncbi:hypothetical protein ACOMHN_051320 [Nucella lapillus]